MVDFLRWDVPVQSIILYGNIISMMWYIINQIFGMIQNMKCHYCMWCLINLLFIVGTNLGTSRKCNVQVNIMDN